ncbi:hypothetical protein THASP1DRAFT_29812 [Thamnocephalis sphaerospora]|uniref:Uncharacterized protein n=1 Tax=Thamnocephalis sphaerospora TaxID=78915 RepID=A0A4V1IWQ5_9FUNG|nr:hypothetical protein THASP1DRAFT_29812 [Thamnocephalis sphaerospora]|eukprot:RKP08379.1 hypothetical protein THASP1DRAFT_29812 [Thamnocephalis sphaerospora]
MALLPRNELLLILGGIAYATNPNEISFQQYIERQMAKRGHSWLQRKFLSHITAMTYQRKNYYLFSIIHIDDPSAECNFLGIFNHWIPIPKLASFTSQ